MNESRYLNLSQIAAGLGVTRGRISQLKKSPRFPQRHHRRGLTDWYDDAEIREFARQTSRNYLSPVAIRANGDEWWSQPGRFSYKGTADVNGNAWIVYDDGVDRVALRFHMANQAPQRQPVIREIKPTWIAEVKGTWMDTEPEVIAESTEYSAIEDRVLIGLSDVAKKLGEESLPYLQRAVSRTATELMLARPTDKPYQILTKPRMPNLDPAYRLYAHTDDDDIRAATGSFINTVRDSNGSTYRQERGEVARASAISLRGAIVTDAAVMYTGDPGSGFDKIVYGPPHELYVDFVEESVAWGGLGDPEGEPVVASGETYYSPVLIDLVASTWKEVDPYAGHAYLMGFNWNSRAEAIRYFEHPSTRELAVIYDDHVGLTWKPRPDLNPMHLVFIDDVGVSYIDQDGIIGVLSLPQAFGYHSGNISTAVRAAALVGLSSLNHEDIVRSELVRRLDEESIELNTLIPVEAIRGLLR